MYFRLSLKRLFIFIYLIQFTLCNDRNFLKTFIPTKTDLSNFHIYPTPPLGQDMTQDQFLSGVYKV